MGKIQLIDAETLYYKPLEHPKMLIDGVLSDGLAIMAGDSKIGKSWMVLWMCLQISKGEPVWALPTRKTDVVYAQTVSVLCAPPLYRAEKLNIIEIVQRRDNAGDHSAALCSKPGSDRIWGELQLIYRVLHPFCRVVPEQRPVVEISRHCRR